MAYNQNTSYKHITADFEAACEKMPNRYSDRDVAKIDRWWRTLGKMARAGTLPKNYV